MQIAGTSSGVGCREARAAYGKQESQATRAVCSDEAERTATRKTLVQRDYVFRTRLRLFYECLEN